MNVRIWIPLLHYSLSMFCQCHELTGPEASTGRRGREFEGGQCHKGLWVRYCQIVPMTEKALHAFLWDALSFQCMLPVLKQFLASIQVRHSRFKLGSPIGGDGNWTRMIHAVSRFQGRQRRSLYPIHRDIVVKLLRVSAPAHSACTGLEGEFRACWAFMSVWRDCLGASLLMICCNRPDEGDFQLCDFFLDDDVRGGYEQFRGGATLNTKVQKNDQLRSGCGKRFGRSMDPSLDVADQVLAFTSSAGLVRDPRCKKDQDRSMDCPYCPLLLPLNSVRRSLRAQTLSHVSPNFSHDSQSA